MDVHLTSFWTTLGGLSAPALATMGALALIWALTTGRLVLGKQYRAERERGDKYEEAHRTATAALIENVAGTQATISIVSSFREELAKLAARRGERE